MGASSSSRERFAAAASSLRSVFGAMPGNASFLALYLTVSAWHYPALFLPVVVLTVAIAQFVRQLDHGQTADSFFPATILGPEAVHRAPLALSEL
jgi:hypothetical protein